MPAASVAGPATSVGLVGRVRYDGRSAKLTDEAKAVQEVIRKAISEQYGNAR